MKKNIIIGLQFLIIVALILYIVQDTNRADNQETEIKDKDTRIEEFENTPEISESERTDITWLINTFTENENDNYWKSWKLYGNYIKKNELIPLSDGLEDMNDSIAPYQMHFMAKLTYNGENLDSDIYGQSHVQEIILRGPGAGVLLLVIDSRYLSKELREKCDDILKDTGFSYVSSYTTVGCSYSIYEKGIYHLVLTSSGGSGGNQYVWYISDDKDIIEKYLHEYTYLNNEISIFELQD